jgi:predicted glycoside hydrolase/deacetylase ChbG (UPF0249 family)
MRVIINADDFGYSPGINDAICSLMSARKVTSATIMANAPAFKDAVHCVGDFPACSFGVHLNLTEFHSLTFPEVFCDSGIVNEEGLFTGRLRRTPPSLSLAKAIEKEWGEQIVKVLDHGVPVSHLDSHHHTHTIPWLFVSLKRVQRRFRIGKVRATMNWYYWKEYSPSKITLLSKKAWNWSLRHFYRTKASDHFTSFQWFIANLRNGERFPYGVAELMCHPGQAGRSGETELLWSDWAQELPFKIDLISYNDL